jgi:hypothetical protein
MSLSQLQTVNRREFFAQYRRASQLVPCVDARAARALSKHRLRLAARATHGHRFQMAEQALTFIAAQLRSGNAASALALAMRLPTTSAALHLCVCRAFV